MAEQRPFDPALMGRDLDLIFRQSSGFFEDADLVARRRRDGPPGSTDLTAVTGVENFTQAVANRLKTSMTRRTDRGGYRSELSKLGHDDYGSRHHELIGEPNVERTRNLIKLYVLQALRREPRIEKVVSVDVRAEHDPPRDAVRIEMELIPLRSASPVNLVVLFSLAGAP